MRFLPVFAGLFLANLLFSQNSSSVQFSWGSVTLSENLNSFISDPRPGSDEAVNGRYVRLMQCETILSDAQRALAERSGLEFLEYYHTAVYTVSLPEQFDVAILPRLGVRSMTRIQPEWKLAVSLREKPYGAWAVNEDFVDITVQVYPHISIPRAAEICRNLGFTVLFEGNQNGILNVRLQEAELLQLAAQPFVQVMELIAPPPVPDDKRGRSLHRANLLDSDSPSGLKFNGEGVKALVRDDGIVGPHIDFQGRLFNLASNNSSVEHADGVAGIIGAAGNRDPYYKGMAPGASVYVIDYLASFQDQTLALHQNDGITITNSSYSESCNQGYNTNCQTVDRQLNENPTLMHVFSAGNMGVEDCGYGAGATWGNITGGHKTAKNALCVANVGQSGLLENSSSRGPTKDGRLKPDIAANGYQHFSTDPDNAYSEFGGTSAASPGIAGILAQLTHAFKSMNNGSQPPAALLKIALLNSAIDQGNPGPDFKFGFGLVNSWRAMQLLRENRYVLGQVSLGGNTTHTLAIPNGVRQAKIMVYWAERQAAVNAVKPLLNDLDLTVQNPAGQTLLPLKLNPAPTVLALNSNAVPGRDSLNNIEQVVIDAPAAGTYTINVKGTSVPFGPQPYYIAWEFYTDDIKVTSPNGGEGLVPGSVERIHWDAYGTTGTFFLRYSTDGGENWDAITSVTGDKRLYDWTVPNTVSGKALIMVIRGTKRDTSDAFFTIAKRPANVKVVKVCPDSVTIGWTPTTDTLAHHVYLLGEKYMDLKGGTDVLGAAQATVAADKGGHPFWYAASAGVPGLGLGDRTTSDYYPGELLDCPQPKDLGVRELLEPVGSLFYACAGGSALPVTVLVKNEGLDTVKNTTMYYQINDLTPVSATLASLAPGSLTEFTFPSSISLNGLPYIDLKVWSSNPDDRATFNDTLQRRISYVEDKVSNYFTESFLTTSLPNGWIIQNPDNLVTWRLSTSSSLIGANGLPTRAIFMNLYAYEETGREDHLYLVPMDLTKLTKPGLQFNRAYRQFSMETDTLRLEIFPGCDLNAKPVVVWQKQGSSLATQTPSTTNYTPSAASHWRLEAVDLSQWAGQQVIARFTAVNDHGNNLYLDDISLINYNPVPPEAPSVSISESIVCTQDTVEIGITGAVDPSILYSWRFGNNASPVSAVGAGPHKVRYTANGLKNVRLVVTNAFGTDTSFSTVQVTSLPTATFNYTVTNQNVTFTDALSAGSTYLWTFGDGSTSTLADPVHSYADTGTYTVTLKVTNPCGSQSSTKTVTISTVVAVQEPLELNSLSIQPNPTEGDFDAVIDSRSNVQAVLRLFDPLGRLVHTRTAELQNGRNVLHFTGLNLARGIYQLQVQTQTGEKTFKIAVQ